MSLLDSFLVALRALSTHKLRSSLTMLGLVVGVSAVIILMSIGRGVQASITSQMRELGPDVLFVMPGRTLQGGFMGAIGSARSLTLEDAQALERSADAPAIAAVAPYITTYVEVVAGQESVAIELHGTSPNFNEIMNWDVAQGSSFDKGHMQSQANVIILGHSVAETLFEDTEFVGQSVKINGVQFRVIGVLEKKGTMLGISQDEVGIMPLTSLMARVTRERTTQGQHSIGMITIKAASLDHMEAAKEQAAEILRKRHRLKEDEKNDFVISSIEELLSIVGVITGILTIFLASIASVSLIVGGIGIMNIMLVTVTERTKEIGIRRAVGAKRRDIMLQFLIESATLSLTGGTVGLLLGLGISKAVSMAVGASTLPAVISPDIIVLALSVAVVIGVFFGIYPAYRAARLDPVEALRYE